LEFPHRLAIVWARAVDVVAFMTPLPHAPAQMSSLHHAAVLIVVISGADCMRSWCRRAGGCRRGQLAPCAATPHPPRTAMAVSRVEFVFWYRTAYPALKPLAVDSPYPRPWRWLWQRPHRISVQRYGARWRGDEEDLSSFVSFLGCSVYHRQHVWSSPETCMTSLGVLLRVLRNRPTCSSQPAHHSPTIRAAGEGAEAPQRDLQPLQYMRQYRMEIWLRSCQSNDI
jgi:hypothetical protein